MITQIIFEIFGDERTSKKGPKFTDVIFPNGIDISDTEFIELVDAFIENKQRLIGMMIGFIGLCSFD